MSRVYKAVDLRKVEGRLNDPYVAVKLLLVPVGDYSHSIAVLQSEAQKLQNLAHPNIVRVIDCDRDGHTVFMTMEYLTGEPLKKKFLAPGFSGLPQEEAMRITECIASALAFAHRLGIVHGDLKPGNVIITDKQEVKVIDFGIARVMKHPAAGEPSEEAAAAMPLWGELTALPPRTRAHRCSERQEPDTRDDIYALACITYEMLTGRHPFDRTAATVGATQASSRRIPRAFSQAIQRAVARPEVRARLAHAHGRALHSGAARYAQQPQAMADPGGCGAGAGRFSGGLLLAAAAASAHRAGREPSGAGGDSASARAEPGQVFRDCPTCPLMMVLAPGRFTQGSAPQDVEATRFEGPQHAVSIAYPLGVGVNEITQGEFREFIDATAREMNGCETYDGAWRRRSDLSWKDVGYSQTALHPVSCVSWDDAQAYAQWLSQRTGQKYRLPSASEWEYAARAGSATARPWGANSDAACALANVADQSAARTYPGWKVHACRDEYVYSAPVGSFAPNAFGLHDMLGNVFEWTEDCWQDDYAGAPADGSARLQGDCTQRELRGGSWFTAPAYVRSAYRNRFAPDYRSTSVGFRIARDIRQ